MCICVLCCVSVNSSTWCFINGQKIFFQEVVYQNIVNFILNNFLTYKKILGPKKMELVPFFGKDYRFL